MTTGSAAGRSTPGPSALSVLVVALVLGCGQAAAAAPTPRVSTEVLLRRLMPAPSVPGDPERGRSRFTTTGCGGCHTLDIVPGATGVAGPNLDNVTLRPTLAGDTIPMSHEMMVRWLVDPSTLKPGSSMPRVGLTESEARDITALLFSQPYNPAR